MEPTEGLWAGVGQGVANAEGWMVVASLTVVAIVIGVVYAWARYVHPDNKEIRLRELALREKEAENARDRIKANVALAENMRGLKESNDSIAQYLAATSAGIEESKTRSREMGGKIDRIDSATTRTSETVEDTNAKVTEMRERMHDLCGMLNKREEQG